MQRRMGVGELLDDAGRLVERGWATAEVRRYRWEQARPAQPERLKEWDYYCILTPDVGLALTVADNGCMGFLGVSWMDFGARTFVNGGVGMPEAKGAMSMPPSADVGDIETFTHKSGVLDRHCAAVGRDPTTIVRSQVAWIGFLDDGAARPESWPPVHVVAGSAASIAAELIAFRRAGVHHVQVRFMDFPSTGGIIRFVADVLPALAAAWDEQVA